MIEVKGLRKVFSHKAQDNRTAEKVAVDGLDLTVATGEVFGLLGPNGAGKTTTIRMLTMLARPTAGTILYDGKRLNDATDQRAIKQMIGVVPQNLNLSVGENLELHARLYHLGVPSGRSGSLSFCPTWSCPRSIMTACASFQGG